MKAFLFLKLAIASLNAEARIWKIKTVDSENQKKFFIVKDSATFQVDNITCDVIDAESGIKTTERKIMTCSIGDISVSKVSLCDYAKDDFAHFFTELGKHEPLNLTVNSKTIRAFLYCED